MPWTDTARGEHSRKTGRYPSDMLDREWALIGPLLPAARPGGRPRTTDLREVMNAILYMASSGCQWRALPKDFPPMTTVQGYFYAWRDMGLFAAINRLLVMSARELEGREASPTAGVIDSETRENDLKRRGLRLRCRQEDQGPQAAYSHRHARAAVVRDRPRRGRAGPRRRAGPAQGRPPSLPLAAPRIRRRRLCRRQAARRAQGPWRLDNRDHQAIRRRKGLRGPAATLGGRAHLRLARTMPPPRQRLGAQHRKLNGVGAPRQHPPHDPKARKVLLCLMNFGFRL
jgi:transposase